MSLGKIPLAPAIPKRPDLGLYVFEIYDIVFTGGEVLNGVRLVSARFDDRGCPIVLVFSDPPHGGRSFLPWAGIARYSLSAEPETPT